MFSSSVEIVAAITTINIIEMEAGNSGACAVGEDESFVVSGVDDEEAFGDGLSFEAVVGVEVVEGEPATVGEAVVVTAPTTMFAFVVVSGIVWKLGF